MPHQRALVAVAPSLLAFLLVACGGDPTAPADVDLSGQWSGSGVWSSDTDTDTITLELSLQETEDGSLSGSGSYANEETDSSPITVLAGSHSGSSFSMERNVETYQTQATYSGAVEASDGNGGLDGTLDSGHNTVSIVLRR